MKKLLPLLGRWFVRIGCLLIAVFLLLAFATTLFGLHHTREKADAAIVLGAAAWGDAPSPVFQERLNHAADLYRLGQVRFIIVTGGIGEGKNFSEGAVGREYLLQKNIPEAALLTEETSHTTWENLYNTRPIAQARGAEQFHSGKRPTAYAACDLACPRTRHYDLFFPHIHHALQAAFDTNSVSTWRNLLHFGASKEKAGRSGIGATLAAAPFPRAAGRRHCCRNRKATE